MFSRAREENDGYETQLNNSVRAPFRPNMESETNNIFLLPRKLIERDEINVTGVMSDNPHRFSVALAARIQGVTAEQSHPDYNNIPAQLEFTFSQDNNMIILTKVKNGQNENSTNFTEERGITSNVLKSSVFPKFSLSIVRENQKLKFIIGETDIESSDIEHNDIDNITYLIFSGDLNEINRLVFQFNN